MGAPTKAEITQFFWEGVLAADMTRLDAIVAAGILSGGGVRHPLFESAVTHGLICLNDLLSKLASDNRRIAFVDDIEQRADGKVDITDLVRTCRNAACHMASGEHRLGTNRFVFCVQAGKGVLLKSNEGTLECAYHDDVALFWGGTRLYLERHFLRAYREAKRGLANY